MRNSALIVVIVLILGAAVEAGTIDDTFDGPGISPQWNVIVGPNTAGWDSSFQAGAFEVTDVRAIDLETPGNPVPWASVGLQTRPVGACNFDLDLQFSWGSEGDSDAKIVYLEVINTSGRYIGGVGYLDLWIDRSGRFGAWGEVDSFGTAAGTLPHAGTASVGVARTSGQVSIDIDGSTVLSFDDTTEVAIVQIRFGYKPLELGAATFGDIALHDFQGSFGPCSVVPLPSAAWAGIGLLGLLGVVRRRKN